MQVNGIKLAQAVYSVHTMLVCNSRGCAVHIQFVSYNPRACNWLVVKKTPVEVDHCLNQRGWQQKVNKMCK